MVNIKSRGVLPSLVLLLFLWLGTTTVSAQETVIASSLDNAGLFTESEQEEILELAEKVSEETGWDIIAVTSDDTTYGNAQTTGEVYFNDNAATDNGVVCLIDMDQRELRIVTAGEAISYLTDSRIDDILDQAYEDASNEDYAQSMMELLNGVLVMYQKGVPDNSRIYDTDTGEVTILRRITLADFLIGLGAALGVAGFFAGSVILRYRMKSGTYHYDPHEDGKLDLKEDEDILINQIVTQRRIPRSNTNSGGGGMSGRGGSSVHSGAGGRSFGGGGRKF
ncbi:MAG: TPM domain-containing protein [Lachnospiraceae bacterium]